MLLSGVILISIMISSNPISTNHKPCYITYQKFIYFQNIGIKDMFLTLEENTTYRFVSKPFISLIKPCMIDTPSNIPL